MSRFYEIEPSPENCWRAIVLFGRNTASYKFALAKALFELAAREREIVTLDELAAPYAKYLCEHIRTHPKQSTNQTNSFIERLQERLRGEISEQETVAQTVKLGFRYVLDAFHNVHGQELSRRFFLDERPSQQAIRLTDCLLGLQTSAHRSNLLQEVEARWRLVEAAWEEDTIPRHAMLVEYDPQAKYLVGASSVGSRDIASARAALNGYQKGRCFYCFREIEVDPGKNGSADVGHFFPAVLKRCDISKPVDGVANLVLACPECSRAKGGNLQRLPSVELLERLFNRNEYLISSHHPLRETLIAQTGSTVEVRQAFLKSAYNCATEHLGASAKWQPARAGIALF